MPLEFQCCFCGERIERGDEKDAVILNASSLAKWKEGRVVDGQSFYAHATCLIENCKPSYPWELEAILTEGDADEASLRVSISRWVDDAQPGFVECEFVDTSGLRHMFVEKAPVVSADHIDARTELPVLGSIACMVVSRNDDGSADIEIDLSAGRERANVRLEELS